MMQQKIIRIQPFDVIIKDLDSGKVIREMKKEDNPAFSQCQRKANATRS